MSSFRPAVRVLCVDDSDRVLLIRWRDPADGTYVWEPPGGGIESGESPLDAARRELGEETSLPGAAIADRSVPVHRDAWWNGERHVGVEAFYYAKFDAVTAASATQLQDYEVEWFDRHAWVPWAEIATLPDRVEPPEIIAVLGQLAPDGPWAARAEGEL
jgi:8-oxo-dGTP pyrophosphatase MutT (NUDIX family)